MSEELLTLISNFRDNIKPLEPEFQVVVEEIFNNELYKCKEESSMQSSRNN